MLTIVAFSPSVHASHSESNCSQFSPIYAELSLKYGSKHLKFGKIDNVHSFNMSSFNPIFSKHGVNVPLHKILVKFDNQPIRPSQSIVMALEKLKFCNIDNVRFLT